MQPSVAVTVVCPHCGIVRHGVQHSAQHIAQCPYNPEVAPRLRAYLHEHAVGGYIMPIAVYHRACTKGRLPSKRTIEDVFGCWSEVAKWAGLCWREPPCPAHEERRQYHVTVDELDQSLPGGYMVCSVRQVGGNVYMMLR